MWRSGDQTQVRGANAAQAVWRDGNGGDSVRALRFDRRFDRRFNRINSRAKSQAVIECFVTGLLAWRDGQPGQVGNEAATAVFHQCRGSGSSPSSFCSFCFSPLALALIASVPDAGCLCAVVLTSRAPIRSAPSAIRLCTLPGRCATALRDAAVIFFYRSISRFQSRGSILRPRALAPGRESVLHGIVTDTISR
ncbi:MAG: hypothetical protein PCALPYG88_0791 [uncultured Paraburkholderia sp.]|nr:MAG: hypothetical protein PCALPYG08_0861 [uncultured Paraburkholderia sp.]CAH2911397.1 MAG: hypothetical protein PCALPYG88_0791 [uncultured Paraburkholderia sp.]